MEKRLLQLAIALTIIGLLVSIYMTIFKFMNNPGMCVGSRDCLTVDNKMIGAAGYAAILQQNGTLVFFGISLTGFFFYAVFDLCRSCPGPGILSILHHITERDDPHLHPLGHPRGTTTLILGGKHAPY